MSLDNQPPVPVNHDDGDMGPPITALMELEQDSSPSFLPVLRRRIYRRLTASQLASFSYNIPKLILAEVWTVLIQLFAPREPGKGGQS